MTAAPRLELRLLGRFAVLRDGVEIPAGEFGGRKVRTLLRILATRRGSFVSNEALTEMLWPQRPPADPAANLQVLVTRARKALGDPLLVHTGPGGYSLSAGPDCIVDADRFVASVEQARRLPTGDALAVLTEALRNWAGDPLAEDAYTDWGRGFRDRLMGVRQSALELAAGLAMETGDAAAAVPYARAAAEAEPLREVAALTLVRALAAAGDRAAALARYDQFRRALADELGLDPSPEATGLHRQLLTGSAPTTPAPAARARAAFTGLPFVGRGVQLRDLLAAVSASRGCTLLLAGGSGSGKSRLVHEVADRVATIVARAAAPERTEPWSLTRGLLREVLAQDITYRESLPGRLSAALGILLPELDPPADRVADPESLRALVQEAAIRLLAAADQVLVVDDLQWADPSSVGVIETARARLPDLRLVLAFRPEEIAEGSAAAALLGRVPADVRVNLGGLTRAAIAQLVVDEDLANALAESTDRTPLAIAEVLRALTGEGLVSADSAGRWRCAEPTAVERAARLGEHGQWKAIGGRADRQQPQARLVLDLLCLLAREAPAGMLAVACGATEADILDRLDGLLRAGLVRLGDLGWATSHDMVSEALAARMNDAQRGRLHGMLAQALEQGGDDPAELARHWREAGEPVRAANAYARAARQALDSFADREAVSLCEEALALGPPPPVAAAVREIRGQARTRLGDIPGARDDLRAALTVQRGPDRARLLGRLAMLASGSDDLVRAAELAELALVEAAHDQAARAQALEISAILDMNLGRTERAGERSAEALRIYEQVGDAQGTARVLDAQAMATFLAGDIAHGGAALRRAADLFEDSGDLVRVVTPRSTSGHALVFAGRADDGLVRTTNALDLARTLGHLEGQAYALWHRTEALAALGNAAGAMADAREALAIATRLGHRGWTATSWRAIGIAAQAAGDLEDALRAFENCLAVSEHLDLFASWAAARAALVLVAIGDPDRAAPLVTQALSQGPPLGHYEGRLAQAELAAATGDPCTASIARGALVLADRGGAVQGRARLAELATAAVPATAALPPQPGARPPVGRRAPM
jgi:DNA-binding SARP family transcriptional activator